MTARIGFKIPTGAKGASHEWGSLIPTICANVWLRLAGHARQYWPQGKYVQQPPRHYARWLAARRNPPPAGPESLFREAVARQRYRYRYAAIGPSMKQLAPAEPEATHNAVARKGARLGSIITALSDNPARSVIAERVLGEEDEHGF